MTTIDLRQRPDLLARSDHAHREPRASERPGSSAQAMNLLGAPPGPDVSYFSERARSLISPQAAFVQGEIPVFQLRGAVFDAMA